jgi:predicted membrane chloride channel (bestrophin family)
MMTRQSLTTALFLVSLLTVSRAFTPRSSPPSKIPTRLDSSTKEIPVPILGLPPIKDIAYGEESRKFRRTVYSHDDWRKHRNPNRFIYYLIAMGTSGVYRNMCREVITTVGVATFICVYNAITGGYTDFQGVEHAALIQSDVLPMLQLPLTPFTLASPSLGLLLVFRTNTSYKRWDEARKNWGMNINHTRDLVRMGNAFYDSTNTTPQQRQEDLNYLALCTWSFVRCMKRHLSPEDEDEADFKNELYEKLPYNQAKNIIKAAHRPNRALQDLSYAIDALPMHFTRKNQIHEAATIFEDNLGSSERLLTSPVPLFYTRHTARFLSAWLLLLPFALYEPFKGTWNHVGMIPATALLGVFLFGIDEIATQLEEPFTILPMQAFCDKIYNWCFEISSFARGDNGQEVKKVKPEHQYFAAVSPPVGTPHHKYVQVKDVGAIKTDDENNLFPLSFEEFLATQRKT